MQTLKILVEKHKPGAEKRGRFTWAHERILEKEGLDPAGIVAELRSLLVQGEFYCMASLWESGLQFAFHFAGQRLVYFHVLIEGPYDHLCEVDRLFDHRPSEQPYSFR